MPTWAVLAPEIDLSESEFIGFTWQRDAFGRRLLQGKTPGWHVADWCSEWLLAEDGGLGKFTKQLRSVRPNLVKGRPGGVRTGAVQNHVTFAPH